MRLPAVWLCVLALTAGCASSHDTDAGNTGLDALADSTDVAPEDIPSDRVADLPSDAAPDILADIPDLVPDMPDWQEDPLPVPCPGGLPAFITDLGGGAFLAELADWDLHVSVIADGIVRLRWLDPGTSPDPDHSYAVVPQEQPELDLVVYANTGCDVLVIETPHFHISVGSDGPAIGYNYYPDGTPVPEGQVFYSVLLGPIRDALTDEVTITHAIDPSDHFYGFGEKNGGLDRRGRTLTFWNFDPLAWGDYTPLSEPLYQSIPAFVGLRDGVAFGVFTDNTRHMVFDVGDTDPEKLTITAAAGVIDQYVYAGPTIPEVLERYTRLTGRPVLPPRWTLGYHQCRWSYTPDTRVLEVAQEFRDRDIPADGIWLDIDYMDGYRSFTFHPEDFPDPAGLVSDLEGIGFKTTVIIDPGIKVDEGWDVYDTGVAGGHFIPQEDGVTPFVGEVWPGPSVFPDFSSPGARDWWAGLIPALTDVGIRGVWIDMNEPTSFLVEDDHTVPNQMPVDWDGLGASMGALHNVYAHLMARATRQGLLDAVPERRPFILTRAGFAGQQRYTAMWTGDSPSNFPMMAANLPMLLGLGLSGVSHCGSDVGGFSGWPSAQLFARWMALGSISPFFRGHVQTGTPDQEPWEFGEEVEDISRRMISIRYKLLPYYYSLFRAATLTGAPILRPLVWHFQDDPAVANLGDQAMLGPWLMTAPVLTEDAATRTVHLPPARWFEYHSGRIIDGPGTTVPEVPLAALPLYVREGAIIPHGPLMMWSDAAPVSPLTLHVYPAEAATSFTVYEDDGDSMDFEANVYSEVTYTAQRTGTGSTLTAGPREGSWTPPERTLVVRVRRVDHAPTEVTLNSVPLPELEDLDPDAPSVTGWRWDPRNLSLSVASPDHDDFVLEMTYDSSTAPAPQVLKRFVVTLPEGTAPEEVHIAGSFNGWAQFTMAPGQELGTAEAMVSVPRGQWFWYKYTRGDWDTVEKWAGCVEADNRYEFGSAHPDKLDSVHMWNDDPECGE